MFSVFRSFPCDHKGHRPDDHITDNWRYLWLGLIIIGTILALLIHGPITQLADYHHFADQRGWGGIPNAADVLSNLGFAAVGIWGFSQLAQPSNNNFAPANWAAYGLFFAALVATAVGSCWYHLAPDNVRLVWDRVPIALACAGLMAAVWRDTVGGRPWITALFALFAALSVAWWRYTDLQGAGDLRPYLFVQCMPLLLIPLLQWQYDIDWKTRRAYLWAIGLYILAKSCELSDHLILAMLGGISGHTLKHLFATFAAAILAGTVRDKLAE